jgi:hypothetical protein
VTRASCPCIGGDHGRDAYVTMKEPMRERVLARMQSASAEHPSACRPKTLHLSAIGLATAEATPQVDPCASKFSRSINIDRLNLAVVTMHVYGDRTTADFTILNR